MLFGDEWLSFVRRSRVVLAMYPGRFGSREGIRSSQRFWLRVYVTVSLVMFMVVPWSVWRWRKP